MPTVTVDIDVDLDSISDDELLDEVEHRSLKPIDTAMDSLVSQLYNEFVAGNDCTNIIKDIIWHQLGRIA